MAAVGRSHLTILFSRDVEVLLPDNMDGRPKIGVPLILVLQASSEALVLHRIALHVLAGLVEPTRRLSQEELDNILAGSHGRQQSQVPKAQAMGTGVGLAALSACHECSEPLDIQALGFPQQAAYPAASRVSDDRLH